jgi:hypothetical protein
MMWLIRRRHYEREREAAGLPNDAMSSLSAHKSTRAMETRILFATERTYSATARPQHNHSTHIVPQSKRLTSPGEHDAASKRTFLHDDHVNV